MQTTLISLLILLSSLTSSKIILKCRKKELKKVKKKCIITYKDGEDTIKYVKACKKGKICKMDKHNYGYCVKRTEPMVQNSKCRINEECPSNICEKNKCSYKINGKSCFLHSECNINSYCDPIKHKCTSKKKDECFLDEQCDLFQICDFENKEDYFKGKGKCVNIGEKEDGVFSANKFACQSGFINKDFICDTIESISNCELNEEKGGKYYSKITSKRCNKSDIDYFCNYDENYFNSKGEFKIYHNEYHKYFTDYVNLIKKYRNKVKSKSPNAFPNVGNRRFHGEQKYIRKAFFYIKFPNFIGEDKCFVNFFRGQYLFSGFIYFSKAWIFFFVFILIF